MPSRPDSDLSNYQAAGKLKGKVGLMTGGDLAIGRAVAVAFALEGPAIALLYNKDDADAATTRALVEAQQQHCLVIRGIQA